MVTVGAYGGIPFFLDPHRNFQAPNLFFVGEIFGLGRRGSGNLPVAGNNRNMTLLEE